MSEAHNIAAYFTLKQMGESTFVDRLPDYRKIREYVESSKEFDERLKHVVNYQLAHENGMTGFDLLINLFNFDWHLTGFEEGSREKLCRGRGNETFDISEDYVEALTLNSQPKARVIKPTFHFNSDVNTFPLNIAAIRKRITGNYELPSPSEAIRISRFYDIDWTRTNAIVGVKDDDEVGILLFKPPSFLNCPESSIADKYLESQEDVVKFLRNQGFTADYLKY